MNPPADKETQDMDDITDPVEVAHMAFGNEDGMTVNDSAVIQSYVDSFDGAMTVDVYTTDKHLAGGGAFRYRVEYLGPAPEPGNAQ